MAGRKVVMAAIMVAMLFAGCSKQQGQVVELKNFPLDHLDGLITQSNVQIDTIVSTDGKGSLKISAPDTTVVRLFEISDIDIENARLIYQAKLRCQNLEGKAFLEMWCHFPGTGEYFSRGLQTPVSGTMDWITAETPFFLKAGEKPDIIRLNLAVAGKGDVWIDDIKLLKAPLK